MAAMKTIDWNKPVHVMYRGIDGGPATVIAEYNGKAFVTWGGMQTAHSVDAYGVFDVDYLEGCSVINVPEEPANCVALIKYNDDCVDESCRGKWFVCIAQQGKDGDITPMRRSELEDWVKGCEPYAILELPS